MLAGGNARDDILSVGQDLLRKLTSFGVAQNTGSNIPGKGGPHRRSKGTPQFPNPASQLCCCDMAADEYNVFDGPDAHMLRMYYGDEKISNPKAVSFRNLRRQADETTTTTFSLTPSYPSHTRLKQPEPLFRSTSPHRPLGTAESTLLAPTLLQSPSNKTKSPGHSLADKPAVEVEAGMVYKGQWKGELRHGKGVLTWLDGQRYEGNFQNNHAQGHGLWKDASGTTFDGQWFFDQKHGYGKYTHVDGTTYEGEWENDTKSGRGRERWPDSARYDGEFLHGYKHGVGTYTSLAGVYEGQWYQDCMDGDGCYKSREGRVYVGQWKNGCKSGHGKMDYPCGSWYEGEYEDDCRVGEGVYTWADGRIYKGEWAAGKQHGVGCIREADGTITSGLWRDGQRAGDVPIQGAPIKTFVHNDVAARERGSPLQTSPRGAPTKKFVDNNIALRERSSMSPLHASARGASPFPASTPSERRADSISTFPLAAQVGGPVSPSSPSARRGNSVSPSPSSDKRSGYISPPSPSARRPSSISQWAALPHINHDRM